MRNAELWRPSKILLDESRGEWVPNPAYVRIGSLPVVDLVAKVSERLLRQHARGRLLDCGCGDVPYYGIYRPHVTDVVCVDWQASLHGTTHLDREVDLSGPLPFADGAFDTVLLADVLEHIAEPAQLISEIARVLSPGGKLILMVPFYYQIHEDPHDYYRYTRFALQRLAERAGLTAVELFPYGGFPDIVIDLTAKALAPIRPLCWMFLAVARRVMRARLYAKWRTATHERFPLGYCAVLQKA